MGTEYLIGFIVGCLLQAIVSFFIRYALTASGTLRVDHSNPEKDIYRIEIDDLDKLNKKRYVELKIDHHADFSQR